MEFSCKPPHKTEAKENEYFKEGLFYCQKCNTPSSEFSNFFGYVIAAPCECKKQEKGRVETAERKNDLDKIRRVAFDSARSKRFEFTFANDDKRNAKATELLKKYCDNFDEYKKDGICYLSTNQTERAAAWRNAQSLPENLPIKRVCCILL